MNVKITTPDTILYEGDAKLIHLPGVGGSFQILENHAPIVSALVQGSLRIVTLADETKTFTIRGGVIKCQQNEALILVQ
ncbi:MAG: F0F1 ATP synthase subunit epsilon [Bacteroidales bacterium]|nr:F0F1 ATP synthase subunit epsilon [Bacteroidales bacterium]